MKLESLAQKLLMSVGEPIPEDAGPPVLSDVQWQSLGITHPYVIFMTGRCGSTWLTSMLKNTGLVGNPGEFFNGDVAKRECRDTRGLTEYFSSVVARESTNGRFGIEIDSIRLQQIESLINWPSVFNAGHVTTFFLYRYDILAQAWSWVSAKKSGIWHLRTHVKSESIRRQDSVPTEADLVKEILRIRKNEEWLEEFFSKQGYRPHYLAYESLVTELATEVTVILKLLSVECSSISEPSVPKIPAVSKIQYEAKHDLLAQFSCKHKEAMSMLRRDRFGTTSSQLSELFDQSC
jgi:LPS sulfotransferase NodH